MQCVQFAILLDVELFNIEKLPLYRKDPHDFCVNKQFSGPSNMISYERRTPNAVLNDMYIISSFTILCHVTLKYELRV